MSTYCKIENLKELTFKQGKKALGFNVCYVPNSEEGSTFIALVGFLLMAGSIYPPSVKRKGGYYPVCYLGDGLSSQIYEALDNALIRENLQEIFPLNSLTVATEQLMSKSAFCKLFPSEVGYL